MPLQIRRGLEAERQAMTLPLAQGELLYVTDDRKLFVGDGSTVGGVAIASYTNEDAQDAAAALFTSGQHTNISFTYNDSLARINATVNLSQYNGSITASEFRGSIVADDSTLLFNSNTGQLNLQGTIGTPVVPDTTNVYDIGSTSYKFRELYLSGANIYLGGATIAAVGATVNLPAGSTVGGFPSEGVVPGNTYQINIGASDSTIILDYNSASLRGSVVAVDDTILVNGTDKTISNGVITLSGDTVFTMGSLNFGTTANPTTISAYSSGKLATFTGVTTSSSIEIRNSRGSLDAPLASNPGDPIAPIKGFAYDGAVWDQVGSYGLVVDPDVPVSAGSVAGSFFVSTEDEVGASKILSFNSKGILTAPVFKAASYPTISLPSTPEEGWLVFDSTTKEFKGWNGTAWVVLG